MYRMKSKWRGSVEGDHISRGLLERCFTERAVYAACMLVNKHTLYDGHGLELDAHL